MFFNQRSFPKPFDHRPASSGFVILSHWDFDHFALALRYPELKKLQWFAPGIDRRTKHCAVPKNLQFN